MGINPEKYESVDKTWDHLDGYKVIFAYNVPEWFSVRDDVDVFNNLKCFYNKCRWTTKISEKETADLVLFINKYVSPIKRRLSQIYALYLSESPPHTSPLPNTGNFRRFKRKISFINSLDFIEMYRYIIIGSIFHRISLLRFEIRHKKKMSNRCA